MATKIELTNVITKKIPELPKTDIESAIDIVVECMKSELCSGNRIEIRGFGSFSLRPRKAAGKNQHYNTVYYRAPL